MAVSRLASNAARFASYAARAQAQQAIRDARSGASLAYDGARETARVNSYPQSAAGAAILSGVDVGGGHAKVTVANHTRVYPVQGSLEVPDVAIAGVADVTKLDDGVTLIANSATVFLYYDDTTLAAVAPVVKATTDVRVAQAGYAPGRHFLGDCTVPAAGAGPSSGHGGTPPGYQTSI